VSYQVASAKFPKPQRKCGENIAKRREFCPRFGLKIKRGKHFHGLAIGMENARRLCRPLQSRGQSEPAPVCHQLGAIKEANFN
jgi:hypothetical protein